MKTNNLVGGMSDYFRYVSFVAGLRIMQVGQPRRTLLVLVYHLSAVTS